MPIATECVSCCRIGSEIGSRDDAADVGTWSVLPNSIAKHV
jgi:hypothetical protein